MNLSPYSDYTVGQLYTSLESVNDHTQPKQASDILWSLIEKTNQHQDSLLNLYKQGKLSKTLFVYSCLATVVENVSNETHEKMMRVLNLKSVQ